MTAFAPMFALSVPVQLSVCGRLGMLPLPSFISAGGGSTSILKTTFEDRTLRSCSQNSVALSLALLSEPANERLFYIIHHAGQPVLLWDSAQRARLKSSGEIEAFLTEQATGSYMHHIAQVASTTSSPAALRDCQFLVDSSGMDRSLDDGEILTEDDAADICGQFSWQLATERLKRGLWVMRGWPWAMTAGLRSDHDLEEALALFGQDASVSEALDHMPGRTGTLELLHRRHMFRKTSVAQLLMAYKDPQFGTPQWKSDFRELLKAHARVAAPTTIIEDLIGTQKGVRTYRQGSKYNRPQRAMAAVLHRDVLNKRHRWHVPDRDVPTGAKSLHIDHSAFAPKVSGRSLPFNDIVTTKGQAPYYTAKAECIAQNISDLALLSQAHKAGDLTMVENSWVGEVAAVEHKLLAFIDTGSFLGSLDRVWVTSFPQESSPVRQGGIHS